jgi:preflagellin peptidase FlaK
VFLLIPLDVLRMLISVAMLGYASWVDLKTREIYDLVWIVSGAAGLFLGLYEVYIGEMTVISLAFPVLFSAALSVLMGRVGLFGGADVWAFIALSIIHPSQPSYPWPLLGIVSVIYPLSIFSNSAIAGASFAMVLLARNIVTMLAGKPLFEGISSDSLRKLVVMFTGVKVRLASIGGPPFQYPLECYQGEGGGERRLILMPDINDDDTAREIFRQLEERGVEEAWVSNTLPFLVFITAGYALTVLLGDIALSIISWLFF